MDSAKEETGQTVHLEQILSFLKHEVGNSVHALKITLTVLQDNYDRFDDAKRRDYLKRGLEILARQERFITAIKSYSECDAAKVGQIEFLQFWEPFLAKTSDRLKHARIKLIHNSGKKPCRIWADKDALDRVMAHILDNAVEGLENEENPKIEFNASQSDNFLIIQIRDNGTGIPHHDRTKIFFPLFTTKPGRMGMGLAIARKLLIKMDGKIEVRSLSEGGTEVQVWIKT